jgi:hypothetical protein
MRTYHLSPNEIQSDKRHLFDLFHHVDLSSERGLVFGLA